MVITKDGIFVLAKEFKRKNPATKSRIVSTNDSSPPQRFTDKDNAVIEK
jgi:hypothetical protein